MKEEAQLKAQERLQGSTSYEVDGVNIKTSWRLFKPNEQQEARPNSLLGPIVLIPGWSMPETGSSFETLGQTFANVSGQEAYIVDTKSDTIRPNSLYLEAEAVRRFVEGHYPEAVTIAGNSQGGAEAMHLAYLLQQRNPKIKIEGLILLDSIGMYEQSRPQLLGSYIKDIIKTGIALGRRPQMKDRHEALVQNAKYVKDGSVGIIMDLLRHNIRWPKRVMDEMREMVARLPEIEEITAPVVIIQGEQDIVSSPNRIIPDPKGGVLEDLHEREEFLQNNVFRKSSYIRMIVPSKLGNHNVSYSRPESVARASLFLLKRGQRNEANPAVSV